MCASDHHRNKPSLEPILHRATKRICFCGMRAAAKTDRRRAALVRVPSLAVSDPKIRSALRICKEGKYQVQSIPSRRNPTPNGGEFRADSYRRQRRLRPRPSVSLVGQKNTQPLKRLRACRGVPVPLLAWQGAGSRGAAGRGSCSMLVFMRASADFTTAGCRQQPGRCIDRVDRACMCHTVTMGGVHVHARPGWAEHRQRLRSELLSRGR